MQIDWWTLGLQTVNFLIVVWLLSRFLYRPVRRIIEEREAADKALADDATRKAEAAEAARQEYAQKLADLAEAQRKEDAEFHARLDKERQEKLDAARREAEAIRAEAHRKAENELGTVAGELRGEIAATAGALAATALGDGVLLSPAGIRQELTRALAGFDAAALDELKADLVQKDAELLFVSTQEIPAEEAESWRGWLAEKLGAGFAVRFESDPGLIGGVELRFPHAVLSVTVADRLRRASDALKKDAHAAEG